MIVAKSKDVNTTVRSKISKVYDDDLQKGDTNQDSTDMYALNVITSLTNNVNDDSCSPHSEHETTNIYYDSVIGEVT